MPRFRDQLFGLGGSNNEATFRYSVFEELFYDSVHLAYLAHDRAILEDDDDYHGSQVSSTLARASIVSSMLTFECSANCCLDVLPWPRALRDDIDKLPALSKFELFLKSRDATKVIDRGSPAIQGIDDLKSLRDRYVHPKVRRAEWTSLSATRKTVDLGCSQSLKLPIDTDLWMPKHSVVALRAVSQFLNYFFLDLCELSTNQTCELLVGSGDVDLVHPAGYHMDSIGDLTRAIDEWQLSFRFLGLPHSS